MKIEKTQTDSTLRQKFFWVFHSRSTQMKHFLKFFKSKFEYEIGLEVSVVYMGHHSSVSNIHL